MMELARLSDKYSIPGLHGDWSTNVSDTSSLKEFHGRAYFWPKHALLNI